MVKIEINVDQIEKAIEQLPRKQRTKLLEKLQKDTWEARFRELLARIDARLKKKPISSKEITRIVEEARKEYHARSRR